MRPEPGGDGTGSERRAARAAAVAAVAVAAFLLIARFVLVPLHGQGIAQSLTAPLIACAHMLNIPGQTVVLRSAAFPGYHPGTFALLAGILFSTAFYGFAAFAVLNLVARSNRTLIDAGPVLAGIPSPDSSEIPSGVPNNADAESMARVSRRSFLRRSVTTGVLVAGGGGIVGMGVYSILLEPLTVTVSKFRLNVPDLNPELIGLRLVHLTDLHHGPWNSLGFIEGIVERTNALCPDLVLLTGDYVHSSPVYIAPAARALGKLRTAIGVVGVLGNHDWWEDADLVRKELTAAGVKLLDNGRLFVNPERKLVSSSPDGVCIAGVGDYWEDRIDIDAALGGVPAAMPRLLLSHNPDVAEDSTLLEEHPRIDLMLSGHTHGGQVNLPFLGTPIIPSRYGRKYASGFVQGPSFRVFVSRGLGNAVLPVRFRVRPEIAVFELGTAAA